MNDTLQEYFNALDRLKTNNPINVPKGSKINGGYAEITGANIEALLELL